MMKGRLIVLVAASLALAACAARKDLKAPCTASLDSLASSSRFVSIAPGNETKSISARPMVRSIDGDRCGIMRPVNSQ